MTGISSSGLGGLPLNPEQLKRLAKLLEDNPSIVAGRISHTPNVETPKGDIPPESRSDAAEATPVVAPAAVPEAAIAWRLWLPRDETGAKRLFDSLTEGEVTQRVEFNGIPPDQRAGTARQVMVTLQIRRETQEGSLSLETSIGGVPRTLVIVAMPRALRRSHSESISLPAQETRRLSGAEPQSDGPSIISKRAMALDDAIRTSEFNRQDFRIAFDAKTCILEIEAQSYAGDAGLVLPVILELGTTQPLLVLLGRDNMASSGFRARVDLRSEMKDRGGEKVSIFVRDLEASDLRILLPHEIRYWLVDQPKLAVPLFDEGGGYSFEITSDDWLFVNEHPEAVVAIQVVSENASDWCFPA